MNPTTSRGGAGLSESPAPDLKASMIVLGVKNIPQSVKFYKETLGLRALPAPGDLPMFTAGNVTIVLNGALSGAPGGFELVFSVDSVSSVREELSQRGCRFIAQTREVAKDLWVATFTDPDEHCLTLFGAR